MHRPLLFCAVLMLAAGAAWGQESAGADQTEQIRILLERVQQLEKRVSELETRQPAAASPVLTAATAPAPAVEKPESTEAPVSPAPAHQHESQETQAAVHQMETHYPSLEIRGFGDVNFSATDQNGTTKRLQPGATRPSPGFSAFPKGQLLR